MSKIGVAVPTEQSEILPCPLCGGKAEIMEDHRGRWTATMTCTRCFLRLGGCQASSGYSRDYVRTDLIKRWNTRA